MPLAQHKITGYQSGIKELPDTVRDSAAWLKAQFDARTDGEVKECHNGLIDALEDVGGAAGVGAVMPPALAALAPAPPGGDAPGETPPAPSGAQPSVQDVLDALRRYADAKVVEIGSADMQKAVYDGEGEVAAAGGIVPYAEGLLLDVQFESDGRLETEDKTVAGAINELAAGKVDAEDWANGFGDSNLLWTGSWISNSGTSITVPDISKYAMLTLYTNVGAVMVLKAEPGFFRGFGCTKPSTSTNMYTAGVVLTYSGDTLTFNAASTGYLQVSGTGANPSTGQIIILQIYAQKPTAG